MDTIVTISPKFFCRSSMIKRNDIVLRFFSVTMVFVASSSMLGEIRIDERNVPEKTKEKIALLFALRAISER